MLSAVLGAGAQACAKYPKLGGKTHQSCRYNGGPHRVCDNKKESTNSDLTGDLKVFPEGNERREGSLRLNWASCIILINYLYCQEIIMVTIYSVPLLWQIMGSKTLFPFPEP